MKNVFEARKGQRLFADACAIAGCFAVVFKQVGEWETELFIGATQPALIAGNIHERGAAFRAETAFIEATRTGGGAESVQAKAAGIHHVAGTSRIPVASAFGAADSEL